MRYTYETVKKFGARRILGIVSAVSWFFLPFAIWIQVYQYFGRSIFVTIVAFPGWIATLFAIALFAIILVQMIRLDKNLMKHVEYAQRVFDNPDDSKSDENFRVECNKFIVPYVYVADFALFGISGVYRGIGRVWKFLSGLLGLTVNAYMSYSIMTFLVNNRTFLNDSWNGISSYIPYYKEATSVLMPLLQNPIPSTALLFLVSVYFSTINARRGYAGYRFIVWTTLNESYSIFSRITVVTMTILSSPWIVQQKSKSLVYAPFTFPTSMPEIMQKSITNIENHGCNVTKWVTQVNDEKDIQLLKQRIGEQKNIPGLLKILCAGADPRAALKKINRSKPVLFLGLFENTCSILCRVEYDSYDRMFRGYFYFDNPNVKEQFKSIAEIEINEQKKLKGQLTTDIKDMLSALGGRQ